MRLKNKTAIVTGGGRGIGEAVCHLFAGEGAAVLAADIDIESAEIVADSIKTEGGKAAAAQVDITDKASVEAMAAKCLEEFNQVDILINNAGINRDALAVRMKEEQWDQVIAVNLTGTFLACQAVIKPMKDAGGGKIVNTSSIGSLGNIGQANYSASKGGVISLTRTLALELARFNVTVNCVAPGATMTPMFESVPEDMRETFRKMIPMRRFADPAEIAAAHLFFCAQDSSYVTGQTLFVDGGISLGL